MAPLVFRQLEIVVGLAIAVIACASAHGPGWLAAAEYVTAARLGEPVAWAPGHGALAQLFVLVPIGEIGFRVALVSALAAGAAAAGVIALARALIPREHAAGIGAVLALALVASTRLEATTPGPAMLVTAGVAWTVAGLVALRRGSERGDVMAVAGLAVTLASAPWIGIGLALLVVPVMFRRPDPDRKPEASAPRRALLLIPVLTVVPLLVIAGVPPIAGGIGDRVRGMIGALGADAGVVVLGAGTLGLGFAAVTGLRGAPIAIAAVVAVALGAVVSPIAGAEAALAVHAILAIGIAVLATAGVRAAAGATDGVQRTAIAAALSLAFPLLGLAMTSGVPADADAPARAASDLIDPAPAGPGIAFVGDTAVVTAVRHERAVAGLRPDLALWIRTDAADEVAVGSMRKGDIVIADVPAFGRLDDRLARPRGRGFELLLEPVESDATAPEPARYPGVIGGDVAARLALARALWEGSGGRLDHAARAAGLIGSRFDAGATAVLAATLPTSARPALFAFIPDLGTATTRVWIDLLGDDLAWVADLAEPPLPAGAPLERRLHARWRAVLAGIAPPADPAIRELGAAAVDATRAMLTATGRDEAAGKLAP